MRVKTEYGSLEYIPQPPFHTDRQEVFEIEQVMFVMKYLSSFPAKHVNEDEEILDWLSQRGVRITYDRPAH